MTTTRPVHDAPDEDARHEAAWAEVRARGPYAVPDDVLVDALSFSHRRITRRGFDLMSGRVGLEVLRDFLLDLLPTDEARVHETELEMAVWSRATHSPAIARFHHAEQEDLRVLLRGLLTDARANGELTGLAPDADLDDEAGRLIMLLDAISAHVVLYPDRVDASWGERAMLAEVERLRRR